MSDYRITLSPEEAKKVIAYLCIEYSGGYYSMFPEDILDQAVREIRDENKSFYNRFRDVIDISE